MCVMLSRLRILNPRSCGPLVAGSVAVPTGSLAEYGLGTALARRSAKPRPWAASGCVDTPGDLDGTGPILHGLQAPEMGEWRRGMMERCAAWHVSAPPHVNRASFPHRTPA